MIIPLTASAVMLMLSHEGSRPSGSCSSLVVLAILAGRRTTVQLLRCPLLRLPLAIVRTLCGVACAGADSSSRPHEQPDRRRGHAA